MGDNRAHSIELYDFQIRLKALYAHWDEHGSDMWGDCNSFAIATPPASDDLRYLKSSALNIWLLGYEFPETIVVFTKKQIHYLCDQKMASLLDRVKKSANRAVGVEVVSHVMDKGNDGTGLMDSIFRAIGEASPVIGCIERELLEGNVLETKLRSSKFQRIDVTNGLSDLFAVKDIIELSRIEEAALLSASVMRNTVVPRLEYVIYGKKKITHSSLMDDAEKSIIEPARAMVELPSKYVDICYFPIFQSGGKFDLKPSAGSNDDHLYYGSCSVIICALGSRYCSYCSNIARTFLINPTSSQRNAYEVLLKSHEAAINELMPGNKASAVYQVAQSVVQKDAPELAASFSKTAGTGIGLEFCESGLSLNVENDKLLREGMVFNVSMGFHNLEHPTNNPKIQKFSLLLADTVIVRKNPEVLTSESSKADQYVVHWIDDEEEEEAKINADANERAAALSKATLSSDRGKGDASDSEDDKKRRKMK